jgi:hypothetical protein
MNIIELLIHRGLWLLVWHLLTDILIHIDLGMFFFANFLLLEEIC